MDTSRTRRCAALAAAFILFPSYSIYAQGGSETLPAVVVTADRTPEPLQRTASAITVVTAEDLARNNPTSLVDALRAVPGLDVTETGGPGGTTNVRLRGANPGQTQVMIDGVRVNDPGAASGDFDFSMFPPGTVERVEVLRGPQSALYGSDAIGGAINIITKSRRGPAQLRLSAEGGQYGTALTSGDLTGSHGSWHYAFAGSAQQIEGFSRYGFRVPTVEARFPQLERDGMERVSGYGRLGYDAGNARVEASALVSSTRAGYDQATGAFPDTPSLAKRWLGQVWTRGSIDTLNGAWTHSLSVFANRTERNFNDITYRINTLPRNTTSTYSDFIGERIGAEYQGTARLNAAGTLIYGVRTEQEQAATFSERVLPTPLPPSQTLSGRQDTRSVFGLWQLPVGEQLIVSLGGRVDDVAGVDRFATWRATALYLLPQTGTKIRATAATGGKAPTLFQLHAPTFGNPALRSETSFGWDAGIDQSLFDDRLNISATVFGNQLRELIEFDTTLMRYFNVAQAETRGLELEAAAELAPSLLRLKATYTYLRAWDAQTGLTLQRRPLHTGRVALAITPAPGWLIEPRLQMVSTRFNNADELNPLAPYARLDIYAEHRLSAALAAFARVENVTDTRYQEVLNYGTTGQAFYAGLRGTW